MKEPYEEGIAIHSAPSFALDAVKCSVKRKQGHRWAGYRASKICNQGADAISYGISRRAWGLRLRRADRQLAIVLPVMLPSAVAHFRGVGQRNSTYESFEQRRATVSGECGG